MKKILLFLMAFACFFTLVSCGEQTETYTVTFETNGGTPVESVEVAKNSRIPIPTAPKKENAIFEGWFKDVQLNVRWNFNTDLVIEDTTLYAKWEGGSMERPDSSLGFTIHYQRSDKEYSPWCLWLWVGAGEGSIYNFNGEDEYGVYCQTTWESFGEDLSTGQLGFIVRDGSWAKDVSDDRFIDFSGLEYGDDGYYHIYLLTGEATIFYNIDDVEVKNVIKNFDFTYDASSKHLKISFQTNATYSEFIVKQGNKVVVSHETYETDKNVVHKTKKYFEYDLGTNIPDLNEKFTVSVKFEENGEVLEAEASKTGLYATPAFEQEYGYDGELGAIYTKASTTFRVWSPISTSIKLRVYRSGTPVHIDPIGSNSFEEYEMEKGSKGTWEYTVNGDLSGKYYTYFVTNASYPKGKEIVDPYAKSTGINGLRGMVVDFSQTNPEGWEDVKVHEIPATSLTVYESHIADLTSSSTWGGTAANAKLFTGFYEKGTTYTEGKTTVKTGYDHVVELGVNAVQLLPIFDQANDERPANRAFNWGYNPLNYNSLDGIYSSNPYDGYTKIKEFKQLVQAYNEAGINIIMDVVYNHTASLSGTNFDVLMPGYYFRYNGAEPSNGSGCGNETASNMYMFRKFMIDSTEFWASEYKLGGFRFDLMAIHDVETMDQLADNLHKNVSEYVVVYGEPWAGGTVAMPNGYQAATQAVMDSYEGYGCFNDQMRDALIKGGMCANTEKGWITNSSSVNGTDVSKIKTGIMGGVLDSDGIEPEKAVQYVTCHDNYTLYDRIKAAGITDEATIKKMAMLANSVVFTSQGISFMLSGEEILRTKNGDHNSYQSSYAVNEINYALKIKNADMFANYQKLISLKQNGNLLGLDGKACEAIVINTSKSASMIYYDLYDASTNTTYRIVHHNGVASADTIDLSGYTLYLDTLNSNVELTSSTQVKPYQTIIAYKKA